MKYNYSIAEVDTSSDALSGHVKVTKLPRSEDVTTLAMSTDDLQDAPDDDEPIRSSPRTPGLFASPRL